MTVKWNDGAITEITRSPKMEREMLDDGWQIAEAAAVLAPKRTGLGARSIRAELFHVAGVPEVRVSWDKAHFYMSFHEFGWEDVPPEPFLRPAAARFQ